MVLSLPTTGLKWSFNDPLAALFKRKKGPPSPGRRAFLFIFTVLNGIKPDRNLSARDRGTGTTTSPLPTKSNPHFFLRILNSAFGNSARVPRKTDFSMETTSNLLEKTSLISSGVNL